MENTISLKEIFKIMMENSYNNDFNVRITKSIVNLSETQKNKIPAIEGFKKLDLYVLSQYDIISNNNIETVEQNIASFYEKNNYYYVFYYLISNYKQINYDILSLSEHPIQISENYNFIYSNHKSIYYSLKLRPIVMSDGNDNNESYSQIEYIENNKYYINRLDKNSLGTSSNDLIGHSRNIYNYYNSI